MRIRIRHWNQWPDKRRNFCRNLFCGLLTMLILHLISYTGIGQDMLNDSYDFLVKTDFRLSIVPGKDAETVSDAIRIVAFDKESCENSPGQGFWTPRELLGRSVIKAIQLGAKVVVVDFALDKPVPSSYYYTDEGFVEENQRYLSLLRQAVNLAEQKGSVILLPWTKRKPEPKGYTAQYYKLMDTNSHVIRQGSPGIFFNTSDFKVRHLRFYEKDRDRVLISLPILAALYQWHGIEKGHKILTDTENSLRNGSEDIITIPSDGSVPGIRLYPQNKSGECLPARLKFRIAPTALVKAYAPEEYNPLFSQRMVWTASYFLKNEKLCKGKTVLIGPTHSEIGDTHITPIGKMPGVFVVANGLNLFLKGEQIQEHYVFKYCMIALILVLTAYSFARFSLALAALGLTGIFLILNMSFGIWIFSISGLFLDFWLIIAGIAILENIVGFSEIAGEWWKNRRRNE